MRNIINWFKNIYNKFYERYFCYYLFIAYHHNTIHIYSDKDYKFRIKIPYIKFENKIDLRKYLDMYVNLYGFALRGSDKTVYKHLNDKYLCVLSLKKLG